MRQIKGGLVVVFDGIDGTGKTTQLKLAEEELKADGWQVHATRNLGGSPIGEELREVLFMHIERPGLTDFYVGVAIQEAFFQIVERERNNGSIILIDRGPMSLAVYQSYGSGIDKELAFKYADEGMSTIKPELYLVYDADLKTALERTSKRSQAADYFQMKPDSYFKNVSRGYKDCVKRYECKTVSAESDLDTVHKHTMQLIYEALKGRA